MRVLVLFASFAFAAAAPSHLGLPIIAPVVYASPLTVPAGDVQAAVIDAQVKLTDQARAFADQAREFQEQVIENRNEGVIEANDLAKERSEELFWSAEEKKWQALDAAQTAEAALDGAMSSSADNAKSAIENAAQTAVVENTAQTAIVENAAQSAVVENAAQPADNIAKSAMVDSNVKSDIGNTASAAEVASAPVQIATKEAETKSEINTEGVTVDVKAAEMPENNKKEEMANQALRSIINPVPLGLAPFSYQAINPAGYAQVGLRAYPFQIPVSPFYTPTLFNGVF